MGSGNTKLSGAAVAETIIQLPDQVDEAAFLGAFTKFGFDNRLFNSYADVDGFISKEKIESLALQRDCYLSYDLSCDASNRVTSSRVKVVNDYLRAKGLTTWFDQDEELFSGNDLLTTEARIKRGVRNSQVVIVFLTSNYVDLANDSDPFLIPPAPELLIGKSEFEKKASSSYNVRAYDNKSSMRPLPRAVHSSDTNIYFDSTINCKIEFFTALHERGAQMMIPAVMESRLTQPHSWGLKISNALGARMKILLDDFENQPSQLELLYNLVTSRIRPLTKGNDMPANDEAYTQSGKYRSWLKEHTSMGKMERIKFCKLLANEMKIESMASLLKHLQRDCKYLSRAIGMPEKHEAEIYTTLYNLTLSSIEPERQFEIHRVLDGIHERKKREFQEDMDVTGRKLVVVREALNNSAMGDEDRDSLMMRTESKLKDLAATIQLRLAGMKDIEEEQIALDHAYTEASRIEFDLRIRASIRATREKDIMDMLVNVSTLYPATILVRKVLDKIKHYNFNNGKYIDYGDAYSPPSSEVQNLNISKLVDSDICIDVSAAFMMIVRLIRTKADTANQLLQAGILVPLLSLLAQCHRYTESVDLSQYLGLSTSTYGRGTECVAPCCGLSAIRTICRLERYGSVNLNNIRLMAKSGALRLCHDIIDHHIGAISSDNSGDNDCSGKIVGFALDCISSLLLTYKEYITYANTLVLPVSTQSTRKSDEPLPQSSLTPVTDQSSAETTNVKLMLITLEKAIESVSAFKTSRVVVEYACEIISKIVATINSHHDSTDDALSATIYRSICSLLCDVIESHYEHPRTLDWLLYCINQILLCKQTSLKSILDSSIYLHIVTILELHQTNMSVLESVTSLLGNLIDSGDYCTNIQQFYQHDIFSVAWKLLRRYHFSAFIVSSNIYYIMWLVFDEDITDDYISSIRELIFNRLMSDGFCELLLVTCNTPQVLRISHHSIVDMYSNIVKLVNAILKYGSSSVIERVITIGIPEKLLNVLKTLGNNKVIWDECCIHTDFVSLINPKYETKAKLYKCGICEILFHYLQYHTHDDVSVHLFMRALDKLIMEPLISDRFVSLNIKGFLIQGAYNSSSVDIQKHSFIPENVHLKISPIEYESFLSDSLLITRLSSLRRTHECMYSATDVKVSRLNLFHHYKLPISLVQS